KRKRMVRIFVTALIVSAVGITIGVVRSQFRAVGSAAGPDTAASSLSALPSTHPTVEAPQAIAPTTTASAVDPGKVSHPIKPTPSGSKTKGAPGTTKKKLPDGVIEIPDSPDVAP